MGWIVQEYSKAMRELATQVWDPRNLRTGGDDDLQAGGQIKCRIEWVYSKCSEHFQLQIGSPKLKLLDVGSCYNPFLRYDQWFDITAVDLCPAPGCEDSVYQCDFLEVAVGEGLKARLDGRFRQLESLPRGHFDAVVFSFLLEYLPDQRQRLEVCRKAAELLKVNGILYVIRPDSSSMNEASSGLMKKLKVGMAMLGLKRISFEKLTHMWCSAYKNLSEEEHNEFLRSKRFTNDLNKVAFSSEHELFAISQDFKAIDLGDAGVDSKSEPFNVEMADELPFA